MTYAQKTKYVLVNIQVFIFKQFFIIISKWYNKDLEKLLLSHLITIVMQFFYALLPKFG